MNRQESEQLRPLSRGRFCYLDHNATTPVAPEVVEAMLPFLTVRWGNPSSSYAFGHEVANEIRKAREKIAALINSDPREIIFTSCGTESINAAMHSALVLNPGKRHLLTTAVEHSATINYAGFLARQGFEITLLPVNGDGALDLHLFESSIRPDTALASVMWANNETGVIFPIAELAAICRRKNVLFHTDAVQIPGKIGLDARAAGVDYLSLSAHKVNAPKGIGLLYVRRPGKFQPYIIGGQQERGRRGGTENVGNIIAFGRAAELALGREGEERRVRALRDRLEEAVLERITGAVRNGAKEPRLPNTSNIAFDFVEAEAILIKLDQLGICASSGSACTTGSLEPSHVLKAMGLSSTQARGSVRFSLGYCSSDEDVEYLLEHLPGVVGSLRESSPSAAAALIDMPLAEKRA
jgi:cysteine desulfurase